MPAGKGGENENHSCSFKFDKGIFYSRSLHREEEEGGGGGGGSSELTSTFKVTRKGLREDAFDPDKAADKGDVVYYRCAIPVTQFRRKFKKKIFQAARGEEMV